MPFINSIATRIFGLAVVLVCLMVALAGFLLWQVTRLNGELQRIVGYYEPLGAQIVAINEAGLRRRLAFERWYGALGSKVDRKEALAESSANYEKFTVKIRDELDQAEARLATPPEDAGKQLELQHIRTSLQQVESTFEIITARQQEVLALVKNGEQSRAADLLRVLDDLQSMLQQQRNEIQTTMENVLAESTRAASRRHAEVLWTTIFATLTSVLLGLIVASLVTRRLVQPVRLLMTGLQTVEKRDLSIQLPIRSGDEIGVLTHSFNFFINELRMKEEIRSMFGKYVDPRILDQVLLDPTSAEASGGRQEMAVSFGDLVGFTGIGEHLTPTGVVNLLNRHFTLQAEAIQQHHGVVDKFMGDAVMAFWGSPFTLNNDHARLACRAALDQKRALVRLQEMLPEITGLRKNLPKLGVCIGISSGEVVVGNIGSENTRSYTVIGDTVNLASRLEAANRFYGTQILICGTTQSEAGEELITREIDTIIVKGKTETTRIYTLLGAVGDVPSHTLALCDCSNAALAAYRDQNWNVAEKSFQECLSIQSDDGPAKIFLDRIATFRKSPPESDWNGAWTFEKK